MQVAVIIPTFNRCDSLKRALTALCRQTFPYDDYEVIVSVDGSTDSTMEMLREFDAPYRLHSIWNTNAGRSSARNRGIEEAGGDVLIFIDDDMEPLPEFIERHYRHHRDNSRICVLGNIPVNIDEHSSLLDIYLAKSIYVPFMAHMSSPDYKFKGLEFYSGNFSIRRELLREVGYFNTAYNVGEDCELGIRMAGAGIDIVFESEAAAKQYIEKDFAGLAGYMIERGRSNVHAIIDRPDSFKYRQICEYNYGAQKWRLFRRGLIGASHLFPQIPWLVVKFVGLMEKIMPSGMDRFYSLSLDYCYWLGVFSALDELPGRNELKSKIISHREPRRTNYISTLRSSSDQ